MRTGLTGWKVAVVATVLGLAATGFSVSRLSGRAEGESFDTFKQRQWDAAHTPVVPKGPKPSPSPPPYQAPVPWPTGIFEDREAPAYSGDFLATNRWTGTINGNHVSVYAGQAGEDQQTGMLLVMVTPEGQGDSTGKRLHVPSSGPLRVTAVNGHLLTIHPQRGPDRVFNLDTLSLT